MRATTSRPADPRAGLVVAASVAVMALVLSLAPVVPAHAQEPPFSRGIEEACREEAREADPFADVATDAIHAEAIACVWAYNIARGRFVDGDNVYDPGATVNRQQMASFIAGTLANIPNEVYTLPLPPDRTMFDDEEEISRAHRGNVKRLAEAGIVTGFDDGTYGPTDPLDRAQMASFIAAAIETVSGEELDRAAVFDDVSGVHQANIEKIAAIGVTAGKAEGRYAPLDPITRAQMASFLARALDHLVDQGLFEPLAVHPGDGGGLGLVEVRVAAHDGYDRVAFELDGEDNDAGWRAKYVEEARQQGSGNLVEVAGEAVLELNLVGMSYPTDLPEELQDQVVHGESFALDGEGIVEVVVGTIFEGYQQIFIGTTGRHPFTVDRLTDPQVVFIDVEHPS